MPRTADRHSGRRIGCPQIQLADQGPELRADPQAWRVLNACAWLLYSVACLTVALAGPQQAASNLAPWVPGIAFLCLTLVWDQPLKRSGRWFWGFVAGVFLVYAASLAVAGYSILTVLRFATGATAQALLIGTIYHWRRSEWPSQPPYDPRDRFYRRWGAQSTQDLTRLLVASGIAALVTVPFGVVPNIGFGGQVDTVNEMLIFAARDALGVFTGCAAGAITFMGFRWAHLKEPRLWQTAVTIAISIGGAWLVTVTHDATLTWLLLLPSLYVGSRFSVWVAASHSLLVTMATVQIGDAVASRFDGLANPFVVIDTMTALVTFVAISTAMLNQARRHALGTLNSERQVVAEQAELLDRVIHQMNDGVIVLDADQRALRMNESARQLVRGYGPGEIDQWIDAFELSNLAGERLDLAAMTQLRPDPTAAAPVTVVGNYDGTRKVIDLSWRPVTREDGDYTLIMLSDRTADHERVEELTRFAHAVAHDLRSPVTAMRGWVELAQAAQTDSDLDESAEALRRAASSTQRMTQVIEDWLDYSVARGARLEPVKVGLGALIQDVIGSFGTTGTHAPQISVSVHDDVVADPAVVRQVLANLIGNSLKYVHPDRRPTVEVRSRRDSQDWVLVEVADRGIGIPKGEEEAVFEEFHRVAAHRNTYAGSGLGLALCRRLVTRHGGRIWAVANEFGGTTMRFTLPAG